MLYKHFPYWQSEKRQLGSSYFVFFCLTIGLYLSPFLSTWAQVNYYDGKINSRNFRQQAIFREKITTSVDYRRLNACLYFATNEQRRIHNLPEVPHLLSLEVASWHHSRYMALKGYFSHYILEVDRHDPDDRAALAGLQNPNTAENIAYYTDFWNFGGTRKTLNITYLEIADYLVIPFRSICSQIRD
jgi:hypothetical protein